MGVLLIQIGRICLTIVDELQFYHRNPAWTHVLTAVVAISTSIVNLRSELELRRRQQELEFSRAQLLSNWLLIRQHHTCKISSTSNVTAIADATRPPPLLVPLCSNNSSSNITLNNSFNISNLSGNSSSRCDSNNSWWMLRMHRCSWRSNKPFWKTIKMTSMLSMHSKCNNRCNNFNSRLLS